jgi:hypothetical protein
MVKKAEYIEQMKQLYKMPSIPQISTEVEPSNTSTPHLSDPIPNSPSFPVTSLHQSSPFSFSPHLHHIRSRSRYIPNEDDDPKVDNVDDGRENDQSDLPVSSLDNMTANNFGNAVTGVSDRDDREEDGSEYGGNNAPSSLEYSDGEGGRKSKMVVSDDEEEEVDELNSSEYKGLSMAGMMVNTDSGGYYERDMDMADDTAQIDMDDGLPEVDMDEDLPEREVENLGGEMMEDEIPVEMEVDGETCLFSRAALAELSLLRENARLRGEEMDEEPGEFSEEQEYGDMISTVVVQSAPVAGPSQLRRG